MLPQVHLWATAGLVLAVSSLYAAPPLGCIENARGARWCESHAQKNAPLPVEKPILSVDQHPALLLTPPLPFQSIGQVVKSIPLDKLLPHLFEPRLPIPLPEKKLNAE